MPRQTVKFGHYSCNGAFMVCSQGSCVQLPEQVSVERSADRDIGISCQEDHIKTDSYVMLHIWARIMVKVRQTLPQN